MTVLRFAAWRSSRNREIKTAVILRGDARGKLGRVSGATGETHGSVKMVI